MRFLLFTAHCFLLTAFCLPAQAYEYDTAPIESCWSEVPIINITKDECEKPTLNGRASNVFAAAGAPRFDTINEVLQDKLDPLWLDNAAHGDAITQEATKLLRTYDRCLEDLCIMIRDDCSKYNNTNVLGAENYNRCNLRHQESIATQKAHLLSTGRGNITRKSRSIFVEKVSSLSFKFDKWLHPRIREVNSNAALAEKTIKALAKYLW